MRVQERCGIGDRIFVIRFCRPLRNVFVSLSNLRTEFQIISKTFEESTVLLPQATVLCSCERHFKESQGKTNVYFAAFTRRLTKKKLQTSSNPSLMWCSCTWLMFNRMKQTTTRGMGKKRKHYFN